MVDFFSNLENVSVLREPQLVCNFYIVVTSYNLQTLILSEILRLYNIYDDIDMHSVLKRAHILYMFYLAGLADNL